MGVRGRYSEGRCGKGQRREVARGEGVCRVGGGRADVGRATIGCWLTTVFICSAYDCR